ncbi:hypothetical protein [Streptomyces sp. NBC_00582]|uniref:hypothetical protein n=1 Tax=Streptomyces sp. NBC_00582 TaxID=2975783 RepID=UPI001063E79E|nr:hypothetical protein [Streptomyces sp. NBC_00582]WUB61820.1 hypothetical protein OG852_16185 [Streptomyces sp. NBC_00582]
MGTKTVDEAADEQTADLTKTDASDDVTTTDETGEAEDLLEAGDEAGAEDGAGTQGATGVGQGAGAVVSAVLGLVSLSGSWIGTIAGARQTLVGQLQTSSTAGVAEQIQAVYGDAWQATALWAGVFALLALVTGVVVLARPAFGNPGPQAPWIKSVSWAGVVLGVIGLLLAVLKYTDALLGLPSAS